MKTSQRLLLSLGVFLLVSCEKKSADVKSNSVDVTVLNQQGQNILTAPAVYDKSNIEVYNVISGQAQLVNVPNLAADKGFLLLDKGTGKEIIRVVLNYDPTKSTALTLIKFGNTKIDTIKGEFTFSGNTVLLKKVWFNGVEKSSVFSIVK